MSVNTGDKAPDFKLISFTPSVNPVEISLSSFAGKKNVVLIFFSAGIYGSMYGRELYYISDSLGEFEGQRKDGSAWNQR